MDTTTQEDPKLAQVMRAVAHDLKTIASDEIELGQHALAEHMRHLLTKASVALLGAIVALIGFAMLCTAAVAALAKVLPLWLCLIIMAVVYVAIGAVLTVVFAKRIANNAKPDLTTPVEELRDTVDAIEKGLTH